MVDGEQADEVTPGEISPSPRPPALPDARSSIRRLGYLAVGFLTTFALSLLLATTGWGLKQLIVLTVEPGHLTNIVLYIIDITFLVPTAIVAGCGALVVAREVVRVTWQQLK